MLPLGKGEWGGLEKLMFDWFERIDYQSVNVIVAVAQGWKGRFDEEAGKKNLSLQVVELPLKFKERNARSFWATYGFLRSYRLDGIVFFQAHHADFNLGELLAGLLTAKGNVFMHENLGPLKPPEPASKKHFGFIPGLGLWRSLHIGKISLRSGFVKRVLAVSGEIKNRYVEWWNYDPNRVLVAYHGVETKKFFPSQDVREKVRQKLKIGPEEVVLITTARLTEQKRLDRVIEAFVSLSKEFKNLRLLIAGKGPLESELKKQANSLGCGDRIVFLGQVDEPSEYLKASDIFVLSSDNEGLSLALLEAMSTGLVCVSTDCTGSREAVVDERVGLVVEKSAKGVTEGIRKILAMPPSQRRDISKAASDFVRVNFDLDKNVSKVFETIGLTDSKKEKGF